MQLYLQTRVAKLGRALGKERTPAGNVEAQNTRPQRERERESDKERERSIQLYVVVSGNADGDTQHRT